jgi:hypothetical protein
MLSGDEDSLGRDGSLGKCAVFIDNNYLVR